MSSFSHPLLGLDLDDRGNAERAMLLQEMTERLEQISTAFKIRTTLAAISSGCILAIVRWNPGGMREECLVCLKAKDIASNSGVIPEWLSWSIHKDHGFLLATRWCTYCTLEIDQDCPFVPLNFDGALVRTVPETPIHLARLFIGSDAKKQARAWLKANQTIPRE